MISVWVVLACAGAGALIGFVAGATDEPAAGHITAGVTGFVAGLLAASASGPSRIDANSAARIFLIYLVALILAYVLGNILRRHHKLDWLIGRRLPKKLRDNGDQRAGRAGRARSRGDEG